MTRSPSTEAVPGAAATLAPGHFPHPVQTAGPFQAAHLKGKTKEFFPGGTEISGVSQDFQSDAGTQNRPHPSWNVGPRRDLPADLSPHHHSVFRERALPKGPSEATPGSMEGEELECSQQGE